MFQNNSLFFFWSAAVNRLAIEARLSVKTVAAHPSVQLFLVYMIFPADCGFRLATYNLGYNCKLLTKTVLHTQKFYV